MTQNEKQKKNHKYPLHRDVIAIVVAVVLILGYILYEFYSVYNVSLATQTAVLTTVHETIEATALVVRNEHVLDYSGSNVTVASVADGEKVKKGGQVAMEFSSSENAQNYSKILSLQQELDYYENLQSQSVGTVTDVESIDKEILENVNDYIRSLANGTDSDISANAAAMNDSFIHRQLIIGEKIDFTSVTDGLQAQIEAIETDGCSPIGYITTDESGVFSSYTDGCEGLFDYENILDIDEQTLQSYLDQVSGVQSNVAMGKLITSYVWYFCCILSADSAAEIENGQQLQVAVKNSDAVYTCTVVSGAETDLGQETSVLILKCAAMDSRIASMRSEDIEIRYNEYTGFRVPTEAVHVVDGQKGVYVLISNQVKFRKAKIIYAADEYVIFGYDQEDSSAVRLYDQIILEGKDLEDGKVYT